MPCAASPPSPCYHFTTRYQEQIGHVGGMPVDLLAGKYGVYLFFLISGFVIFMTLERTRTAADFVVSRFSRLFPAYWAAFLLTATVVYTVGLPLQQLPASQALLNLTMVQEILGAEHLDGSYWTLQIELFFYVQMLFWYIWDSCGASTGSSAAGWCWRRWRACARSTTGIFHTGCGS